VCMYVCMYTRESTNEMSYLNNNNNNKNIF